MAIITISRGSLSGGRSLARCLGANLGYRVVSREELVQEGAKRYGIDEKTLQKGLEEAPRFWDRFRVDRRIYVSVAQATLCHLVEGDDVVYHGHAGHLLLRGVGHVLRVRIIMPMNQRIPLAVREHGLSEGAAEGFIKKRDEERASWTRFLYGIDWLDPVLYDMTLNLEKFSIEDACSLISTMVGRPEFEVTDDNRRELADLKLASHTHATLFLNPKIAAAAAKIDVKARDGVVHLSGILPGDALLDDVLKTCRELPEVQDVRAEWLGAREEPL
jgi:cytidylate kinase